MKKIYLLIGVIAIMILAEGCKKEEYSAGTHQPSIEGKVIDIREDNEILIEITTERGGYKKGDIVLLGYWKYYWTDPYGTGEYSYEGEPKINDLVVTGYWEDEVEKKDGYDYMPGRSIFKFDMELLGRVIEVRDNNEILVEVTKRGEQYKSGDIILIEYMKYFYQEESEEGEKIMQNTIPKYDDKIVFYYYQENIGEKDGYTYMSNLKIKKYSDSDEDE